MRPVWLLSLALLLATGRSLADGPTPPAPDKSGYDLFHPVPEDLLRDLDTDRPDKTNSPRTVDAGHLQIETGLVTFTRTRHRWTWDRCS